MNGKSECAANERALTSSARAKASVTVVLWSIILNKFWFGITISVSVLVKKEREKSVVMSYIELR